MQSGPADGDLTRWFGDAGRLSVQRAVSELRAGRPVRLFSGDRALIVAAADMLGGERIAAWRAAAGDVGLVLPAPRLRHLGILMREPARVDLAGLAGGDIDAALVAVKPTLPLPAHRAADALETSALELVKRAYLLPAAAVRAADGAAHDEAGGEMVSVEAAAVDTYHDRAARDLSIVQRTRVPLAEAEDAEFVVFRGGDGLRDQIAVMVGRPDPQQPVLTRLHSACLTGDLFGSLKCDCGDQLRLAVAEIAAAGDGVLLYLDQEGRGIGLLNKMRAYGLQELGHDTVDADAVLGYGPDERRYGIAGAMLSLLGFRRITLMTNNPEKITAMADFGVSVVGTRRLIGGVNPHNVNYLSTKAARAGHLLGEIARRGT